MEEFVIIHHQLDPVKQCWQIRWYKYESLLNLLQFILEHLLDKVELMLDF